MARSGTSRRSTDSKYENQTRKTSVVFLNAMEYVIIFLVWMWAHRPLISNDPQDSWESTPASLGNPSNDIDRDEAGCTFRGLEELSDLDLIGVIGDHRV